MSPVFYVMAGILLLIGSLAWFIVTEILEAEEQRTPQQPDQEPAPELTATIIDLDGSTIVPEGMSVWVATRQNYLLWTGLFSQHPGRADQPEVYLYDVVGTPVTPEQQERIQAYYG